MVCISENEINDTENITEYFAKYDNSYLEQYNDLFLLMYTYLHRHKSIEGYVNLTIKDFLLYHNYTPNRTKGRINSKIYDTLNLMIKRGFILYIGCYSNGGLVSLDNVDCDMMFTVQIINYDENWNPENRFTKILYSEIDRIRQSNIKFMGKALFLYVYIKKYITVDIDNEYATKVSFPSENTLSNKSNCGISTVKKYIQFLCDMKMLYMKNYGSYLRMFKGKEIDVNSNNVYALNEKYLDSEGEEALKSYLKFNMGYIDGFYPFCDNLPDNSVTPKSDNDNWGEPNSMEKLSDGDYSLEDIVDMPVESNLVSEPEKLTVSEDKTADIDSFPMNPVKTITIKKKAQNREKPKDIEIQEYAETLYEQYGFGTGYEKSLFIAELSEKYPGLDNYEKYYDRIKLLREMGI